MLEMVPQKQPAQAAPVFCKKCVYFQWQPLRSSLLHMSEGRPVVDRCLHPRARYVVTSYAEFTWYERRPAERNAHNDCPDYVKRTWRTFGTWIRLDPGRALGIMCGAGIVVGIATMLYSMTVGFFR
jgi:hypothetical protein